MHSGQELANILQPFAGEWGYIYGTSGEIWTEAKQAALPPGSAYDLARKYGQKWIGRHVADCSGLVKYGCKKLGFSVPHGSNSQWSESLGIKSEIFPGFTPPAGALVFKLRGDDFYHVGVSLGDGRVVEAQGTSTGVVISQIRDGWSHYGLLKGLNYGSSQASGDPEPEAGTQAVVVGGTLNVRTKAARTGSVATKLPEGTRVEILEAKGQWSRIRYSQEGYVMTKYLEVAEK